MTSERGFMSILLVTIYCSQ